MLQQPTKTEGVLEEVEQKPDKDNAPPRMAAIRILGRRIFQMMLYSLVSVAFFKRIFTISDREI
jgi:hypothetical protein